MCNYLKINIILFFVLFSSWAHTAPLEVFVSILPQQYLLERIGAERVKVNVMVKPGQSPETFEPSPKLMSVYSQSDIYFTIGMPFEEVWIERVASLNQNIVVVNTQASEEPSAENQEPSAEQEPSAKHEEPSEEHDNHVSLPGHHHTTDPHTWLSPVLFLQQAKIVVEALSQLIPNDKEYLYNNYNKLVSEVNVLHKEMAERFKDKSETHFVTFHPAFSYFAKQYGLTQLAIEIEGKEPSAKQMSQIINRIKDKNVNYILIEKQFNQVIPETIAESVGAQLLIVDPLALDYLSNMKDIAEKINKALFSG